MRSYSGRSFAPVLQLLAEWRLRTGRSCPGPPAGSAPTAPEHTMNCCLRGSGSDVTSQYPDLRTETQTNLSDFKLKVNVGELLQSWALMVFICGLLTGIFIRIWEENSRNRVQRQPNTVPVGKPELCSLRQTRRDWTNWSGGPARFWIVLWSFSVFISDLIEQSVNCTAAVNKFFDQNQQSGYLNNHSVMENHKDLWNTVTLFLTANQSTANTDLFPWHQGEQGEGWLLAVWPEPMTTPAE